MEWRRIGNCFSVKYEENLWWESVWKLNEAQQHHLSMSTYTNMQRVTVQKIRTAFCDWIK